MSKCCVAVRVGGSKMSETHDGREIMDILPERFGLLLLCGLIGFFCGGARAIRKPVPDRPFRDVLGQSVASAIAAFLCAAALLDLWAGQRQYMVIAASGIAGWGGALLLDLSVDGGVRYLRKKFGMDPDQEK